MAVCWKEACWKAKLFIKTGVRGGGKSGTGLLSSISDPYVTFALILLSFHFERNWSINSNELLETLVSSWSLVYWALGQNWNHFFTKLLFQLYAQLFTQLFAQFLNKLFTQFLTKLFTQFFTQLFSQLFTKLLVAFCSSWSSWNIS